MTNIMSVKEAQDLIEATIANEDINDTVKSKIVETIIRCVAEEASVIKTYNEVHTLLQNLEDLK